MVDIFSKKWFLKNDRNPTPPNGLYNWYGWKNEEQNINIYTQTDNPIVNNDWTFSTPNIINSKIDYYQHDTILIDAIPNVDTIDFSETKPKDLGIAGDSIDRLTFHRETETRYWKSFDMPNFTSNNTWGTLLNSENSPNAYYIFDNKSTGGRQYLKYTNGKVMPIDWYWTLDEDLILTSIYYWGKTYSNKSYSTNSITVYGWNYSTNNWMQLGHKDNYGESDYNNYTVPLTKIPTNKFLFRIAFKSIANILPSALTELIPQGYKRINLPGEPFDDEYDYVTRETGEWWVDQKQKRVKNTSDYGVIINNQSQISAGSYIDLKYNTDNKIIVDGYKYERDSYLDNNQLITDFYFTIKTDAYIPGNKRFYLPISSDVYINPITVDWGDGTIEYIVEGSYPYHDYTDTGTYQIKIHSTYAKQPMFDGFNNTNSNYNYIGYQLQSIDSAYLTSYYGNSLFAGSPNVYGFTNNGSNISTFTTTIYKNNRQLIGSFVSDYGLYRAFYNCINLKSYNFDKVNSIGKYGLFESFYNCGSLTEIIFKDVENIDEYGLRRCFAHCSNLKQIYFYNLTQSSFGSYTNQFNEMLSGVSDCTVHFPQNIKSIIENWEDIKNYFGGTNITILYDLVSS